MTQQTPTMDLSKFGIRELQIANKILTAIIEQGTPDEMYGDGLKIMFNQQSGYVFLTNDEYQVAMMNGGRLEMHYSTPYDGHEGFLDELKHMLEMDEEDLHPDDVEFINDLLNA